MKDVEGLVGSRGDVDAHVWVCVRFIHLHVTASNYRTVIDYQCWAAVGVFECVFPLFGFCFELAAAGRRAGCYGCSFCHHG